MNSDPLTASPYESLRVIANRMAEHRVTRLPVVDPSDSRRLWVWSRCAICYAPVRRTSRKRFTANERSDPTSPSPCRAVIEGVNELGVEGATTPLLEQGNNILD